VGSSSSTTVFSIDQATGTLFHVNDVPSGVSAVAMAVETTGKFAYIANFNDSSISVFSINQTTGDLTLIDTTATGSTPTSVNVDPTGHFLYSANFGSNNVSIFRIDATTGRLIAVASPVAAGVNPVSVFTTGKVQ